MLPERWVKTLSWLCLVTLLWGFRWAAAQTIPTAAELFPKETAVFVTLPDVTKAKEAFLQSSLGRMVSDPALRPFLTDFWGGVVKAAEAFEKTSGVSLAAALSIPQGELSVGIVSAEGQAWVLLIYLDARDKVEILQKLADFVCQAASKDGAKITTEKLGDIDFRVIDPPEEDGPTLGFIVVDSRLIGGMAFESPDNLEVVRKVVRKAVGQETTTASDSLASNDKFKRFLSSIRYARQGEIHSLIFADPIQMLRGLVKMNPGAAVAIAVLPVLGLDGLNSIGGATSLNVAGWDSIRELHVFLDNPRRGVLDAVAFKTGDGVPEPFIPEDVVLYLTFYLDMPTTVERVARIFDGFRGEGAFDRAVVQQIERRIGLNLYEDILPFTAGRVSLIQWIERPIRVNALAQAAVVELKDAETAGRIVDAVSKTFENRLEKKEFGQFVYHTVAESALPNAPEGARRPTPSFAAIDQYIVFCDSWALMESFFTTLQTPERSLARSIEYKLVRGRIKGLAGTDAPASFVFQRPDLSIEMWYELFLSKDSPGMQRLLQQEEIRNPVAKAVAEAVKSGKLPPIEILTRYFAPQGGLIIDDATGLHFVGFALRKKLP